MTIKTPIKKYILIITGISFLASVIFSFSFIGFDRENIIIEPLFSLEFSLLEKVLIVNYTVFFLFLLFLVMLSAVVIILSVLDNIVIRPLTGYRLFNKLLSISNRTVVSTEGRNFKKRLIRAYVSLILLVTGISICGFFWENINLAAQYKNIFSPAKQPNISAKRNTNVILIVIDTLRADHLGSYGYKRETSPNIDNFAKEGVLFKNCYAPAPWTKPSVASILTSLYPLMITSDIDIEGKILPDEVITVAEILKKYDYVTYGYVANPHLKAIFNFNQGFDFYDDYLMRDRLYYAVLRILLRDLPVLEKLSEWNVVHFSDRINIRHGQKRIEAWLDRHKDETFFMYLQHIDPHDEYSPPPPFDRIFPFDKGDEQSEDIALYDGEIRFVDEYINRFFQKLKSLKIYDETLIIITSDHGESLGEHEFWGHYDTAYQENIKVPLIIKYPGSLFKGGIVETSVSGIDILPTILDVLKIDYRGRLEGKSLVSLSKNTKLSNFHETIFVDRDSPFVPKSVIKDIGGELWKYIYTEKSEIRDVRTLGNEELFNLDEDPQELNNLVNAEFEVLKIMRREIAFHEKYCKQKALSPVSIKLDYETIQQLRSMGYPE